MSSEAGPAAAAACCSSCPPPRAPARPRSSNGWSTCCPTWRCRAPTRRGPRGRAKPTGWIIILCPAHASKRWSRRTPSWSGRTCSATCMAPARRTPSATSQAGRDGAGHRRPGGPAGPAGGVGTRRRLRDAAVVRRARAAAAGPQQGHAKRRCSGGCETARAEVAAFAEYDYVVVNDELDACVDRLRCSRPGRAQPGCRSARRRGRTDRQLRFRQDLNTMPRP